MPIVAPMKAGKSTLINAIIGYPLLPARANPMTTLPTKIKLVDGLDVDQPELALADSTIALFNHVGDEVRGGSGKPGGRSRKRTPTWPNWPI